MLNNINQIYAYLDQYTENERIYREYQDALKNPETLKTFSRKYSRQEVFIHEHN